MKIFDAHLIRKIQDYVSKYMNYLVQAYNLYFEEYVYTIFYLTVDANSFDEDSPQIFGKLSLHTLNDFQSSAYSFFSCYHSVFVAFQDSDIIYYGKYNLSATKMVYSSFHIEFWICNNLLFFLNNIYKMQHNPEQTLALNKISKQNILFIRDCLAHI